MGGMILDNKTIVNFTLGLVGDNMGRLMLRITPIGKHKEEDIILILRRSATCLYQT